ncbi:LmeA family phospholipid-binding protein [Mycolicibacterium brumae]|uniref:DUF2993 domain-containing protein n=1 Tax=Mycolicibacterium brumae TaxID=85968 RepID=A0A2G5PGR3_9MYCO|nr:DUF2993 domain-containing protein [Mycolicibacterium brumae]MCV7192504.1 LmeA family phospholipid-binding protein [Mycolicibacterium brumae]PIB77497.1 DUF2993 domain-containing protein [Mycolicibacterium brumae]RWA18504.1 hypothetical protein MBRU_04615 [Mycolicibacterium brumae DSM 44177]UWW10272.1 DUF2993 domain-containing protein [Mycolicibacterium brumae]
MTYPPHGPSHPGGQQNPSQQPGNQQWSRPPGAEAQPTARIPKPGEEPTTALPRTHGEPATQQLPRPGAHQPAGDAPVAAPAAPKKIEPKAKSQGRLAGFLKDPLSVVLVLVIVIALGLAGLVGGELYARNRANHIVAGVVQCVVQDKASASFGTMPPFLIQHFTRDYSSISIHTDGNNVRDATQMSLQIEIKDVKLNETADAAGTIGSLVADVKWTSEGIKQTLSGVLPVGGSMISEVTTDPSAGTISVDAGLATIVTQPKLVDGGISLEVLRLTGLGAILPRESIQPVLDDATERLTKDYPMGIKADSVTVTSEGVQARFSTANADIPKGNDDPCFASIR